MKRATFVCILTMGSCCSKKPREQAQVKKSVPPTAENMRTLQQQQQPLQRQFEERRSSESDLKFNEVLPVDAPAVDCCDVDIAQCMQATIDCASYTCLHVSLCVLDVASDIGEAGCSVIEDCLKEDLDRPQKTSMRNVVKSSATQSNLGKPSSMSSGGSKTTKNLSREGSVLGLGNLPLYNEVETNDSSTIATQKEVAHGGAMGKGASWSGSEGGSTSNHRKHNRGNSISNLNSEVNRPSLKRRNSA